MMRILVYGYYGYQNLGDDLLFLTDLEYVKKFTPQAELYFYGGTKGSIFDLLPDKQRHNVFKRSANNVLRACLNMDVFLYVGGGMSPTQNLPKLIFYLLAIIIMRLRGKKALFVGIGIDKCNFARKLDVIVLKKIINWSNLFVTRQNDLDTYFEKNWLKNSKAITTADIVFCNNFMEKIRVKNMLQNKKIITFALTNVFPEDVTTREQKQFEADISWFASKLIGQGYYIQFLALNYDDECLNRNIERLCASQQCSSIAYLDNIEKTCSLIAQSHICICMRFHSTVLSLQANIPVQGIAYSSKVSDLLAQVGLNEYCTTYSPFPGECFTKVITFSKTELLEKFNCLQNDLAKIRKRLPDQLMQLKDKAEHTFTELQKALQ